MRVRRRSSWRLSSACGSSCSSAVWKRGTASWPGSRPADAAPPAEPALPDTPRVIRLPVSKRELAARLGTVPETLSRTFDRLRRAEVIRMSGDHSLIEILSFEKLHRLAQD